MRPGDAKFSPASQARTLSVCDPAQKFAKQVSGHIVVPAKAGIQVCDFSGFRVAPGLRRGCPEMMDE
jgi:hypothetical protein